MLSRMTLLSVSSCDLNNDNRDVGMGPLHCVNACYSSKRAFSYIIVAHVSVNDD